MEPYRYCVTFRITHPSIDPDEISREIGLEPLAKWKVGDPRIGPKGRKLGGVREQSFWRYQPHDEYRLSSEDKYLEEYIEELTSKLSIHKNYLLSLSESGGIIEYFIGLFSEESIGVDLPSRLLKKLGELSIGVSLDIYAYKE